MLSLVGQFFKNIAASYVNLVVGLGITFFFTPYLISEIGKEEYGVWSLVFSFLSYMVIADMGMRQALVRFVSKNLALKKWNDLNKIFSSSVAIYTLVASIILCATLVLAFIFLKYFKIPIDLFETGKIVVLVMGINTAFGFLILPFTALGAFNRYDISNYFSTARALMQTAVFIILIERGYGIVQMAFVVLAVHMLTAYGMSKFRSIKFPEVKFQRDLVNRDSVKQLMGYSVYSFLIVIAILLVYNTDNIVIGRFISMDAVAVYSIPLMFVEHTRRLFSVLTIPLVPAISHLEAENDFDRIRRIYAKSTSYLYFLTATFCILIMFFGGNFISLWLEEGFEKSKDILYILAIPAAITIPQTVKNSILYGISKHKIAFYVLGSEGLANLIISLILVHKMGIVGVAIGTAIPQMIIYTVVYPLVFYRALHADVKEFYLAAGRSILYALVLILPPAFILSKFLYADTWLKLIIDGGICALICLAILYLRILKPDDKERVSSGVIALFGKRNRK